MATPAPLTLLNISKTYPNGSQAVREVSLTVNPGSVFGLIGPNGAGKSTLLKVAAGLLKPDFGTVTCGDAQVQGDARGAASFVGLMPDPLGVYTDITALDYLEFFARVFRLDDSTRRARIASTVERLSLGPWLDEEVETLSAGWQRRLALGRILLQNVPVLLLDEPAAGLDISARSELLHVVRNLAREGHTIVVSSHILPELEELADTFGILNRGSWVEVKPGKTFFSHRDLSDEVSSLRWRIRCQNISVASSFLTSRGRAYEQVDNSSIEFSASSDSEASETLGALIQSGVVVSEFGQSTVELNDFVKSLLAPGETPK